MATTWTGAGLDGYWFTSANWSDGIPREQANALFANGDFGIISLTPDAGQQAVAGELGIKAATLGFATGWLYLDPVTVSSPEQTQDLLIGDATLTVAAGAHVAGAGVFTLKYQAIVTLYGSFHDAVGDVLGEGDQVTISGQGAAWVNTASFYLGTGGAAAQLLINQGGALKVTQVATIADGSAIVTGAGSIITAGTLEVGNGLSGTLTIENGAQVTDVSGIVADSPSATVLLTGAGSSWTNSNGLLIGDQTGQAAVTVTDGAKLGFAGGLSIDGTLVLDGTAKLNGSYISLEGGTIIAEPPPGQPTGPDVIIRHSVDLFGVGGGLDTAYLESVPGSRLAIAGTISESLVLPETLQIVTGTVVLQNSQNSISQIQIAAGTLDLAATGAAGGGSISFIGSGTLQVEAGVAVSELITGFEYSGQTLDLAGMKFGDASTYSYAPVANQQGGVLTVSNGTQSAVFDLSGYHNPSDFFFGHSSLGGGTQIYYEGPIHL